MSIGKMWISATSSCLLALLFAAVVSAQESGDKKWNLKLENPFKKKQYVDPIPLTDKKPQKNFLTNPFKKKDSADSTFSARQRSENSIITGGNRLRPFWEKDPNRIELDGKNINPMTSWNRTDSGAKQKNWLQEWDQKHRKFWRTTGENVSEFATNSGTRIREQTKAAFQGISERIKMPQMKPMQWPQNNMLNRKHQKPGNAPDSIRNWRGSEQPRVKY